MLKTIMGRSIICHKVKCEVLRLRYCFRTIMVKGNEVGMDCPLYSIPREYFLHTFEMLVAPLSNNEPQL